MWEFVHGSHVPDTGIYDINVSKNGESLSEFVFTSSTNTHNFKAHNTFDLASMTSITGTGSYDNNGLSITNAAQTNGENTMITAPGTYYIHYDGSKQSGVVGHTTYMITPLIAVGSAPDPNPNPHTTIPTTYWDNFNNRAVATGTAFSSVNNIKAVYQPVVFTENVDLTNTTAVQTFFETNGTTVPSITEANPLAQFTVGETGEIILTHAYTGLGALLGEGETAELSVRDVDWNKSQRIHLILICLPQHTI